MTATNIQNALISRLGETLKDYPLKTNYNNQKPFKIFKHKIPERLSNKFDYSQKDTHDDVYPFCVVKIDQGLKEFNQSMQETTFNLIIGVKNEGFEGEGFDDVLVCIQAIWDDFNHNPLLERKFKFKYPLSWALDNGDEDHHPFYFGGVQVTFESNSLQQVGGYEIGKRTY